MAANWRLSQRAKETEPNRMGKDRLPRKIDYLVASKERASSQIKWQLL